MNFLNSIIFTCCLVAAIVAISSTAFNSITMVLADDEHSVLLPPARGSNWRNLVRQHEQLQPLLEQRVAEFKHRPSIKRVRETMRAIGMRHVMTFAAANEQLIKQQPHLKQEILLQRVPETPATNTSCKPCADAVLAGLKAMKNLTDIIEIEATLFSICHKAFANSTVEKVVCDVFPNAVIFVAELLENRFKFNVANIVCADILSLCIQPCCSTSYDPVQVHLSFAHETAIGNPFIDVRAAWTTLRNPGTPTVWWRKLGSPIWTHRSAPTAGATRTYSYGGWVGQLHSAVMTGLEENATYEYRVGCGSQPSLPTSDVFNFRTLPLNAGTTQRPLRVLHLADMGFADEAQPTINRLKQYVQQHKFDFALWPGDIGYDDGDVSWADIFMNEMQPIFAHSIFMTVLGNHEAFFDNATTWRHRFWNPFPTQAAGSPLVPPPGSEFYRLRMGPVTAFMINSESALDTPWISDAQKNWLFPALAEERAKGRLIWANQHRPLYCDEPHYDSIFSMECHDNAMYLREQLEDQYYQNRVAMVVVGHLHNNQRMWPVYKEQVVATNYINISAPMYSINGGPGNREGNGKQGSGQTPPWGAFFSSERSFMMFEIVGSTKANGVKTVAVNSTTIRSETNEVIDSFYLTQIV